MGTSLLWAAGGTGFTFLMTTLGASVVFSFAKKSMPPFRESFWDSLPES